ncbi:MAG TPA: molybdopterin-dependent oxidoreductase [Albitalea sp.]|uniref:molybdopterin-dependent oxidoreductase n=1 Tax=Piscinibacter sp. TaxID=1903157 RepID=UPI002ECFB7BE
MKGIALRGVMLALPLIIGKAARKNRAVRDKLKSRDAVVQIRLRDGSIARHYVFKAGRITAVPGTTPRPDVDMAFASVDTALAMMRPDPDHAVIIDALKNFKASAGGQDAAVVWFGQLMHLVGSAGTTFGTPLRDGCIRYTNLTNGGPIHVDVRDGRIVRTLPIELDASDAPSWTIRARGRSFTPRRTATVSPHALALKSMVYSPKRALYPMKRVDFDVSGERNVQQRGISGYTRISWDEALDIVAGEIRRMKREHGPGAIAIAQPAHHQWGNINYWLSALYRFGNLVGHTKVAFSPISWEGWYWGAMHHYGNNMRLGTPSFYGTVEDCLQEAEQIVFWSSDPESTGGIYAGFEGAQRRLWAKELGIEFVHIDPMLNHTAQLLGGKWIPIRPGTDSALAMAVMHEWIVASTYDKDYVAQRTTGFDEWRDYLLGASDGVAKTPEWQESETGVPAKDVRSLARRWGERKTYLAAGGLGAGFGGACRTSTGAQWARCMVLMMAMQGWGRPGVNFGNLQLGVPMDLNFYFPGYAEGGISGDLTNTGSAPHNYVRMPHVLTLNPVKQSIPRQRLADAIIDGHASGFTWDGFSLEGQFVPCEYPAPGHSRVHMLYRYGASSLGTIPNSARLIEAYRHPSLEFVVCQTIWHENEAQFADVILPACTSLERIDIAEWANCGGFLHHGQNQVNHRMVVLQHPCIEPLGESKSDYQIFLEILTRLGLGAMFSEGGCSELDWCKRVFDSSDLPRQVSWKQFLKKGYHVIDPGPESARAPVDMRWYTEGRDKDTPEPLPLPGQYGEGFLKGLPTQSGKFEFVASSLRRIEKEDAERPALNRYASSWEGPRTQDLVRRFPLQLVTVHPRYSFHTYGDGKDSTISDLGEHRIEVDGHRYWILRINTHDAQARGIRQHDLVKVHNARGAVICAADVSAATMPGVLRANESCAEFDLIDTPDGPVDRGGCLNLLTPARTMSRTADGISPNSCLVEVSKWEPVMARAA